jgi:predicted tellurium resistance membrane protein TerC
MIFPLAFHEYVTFGHVNFSCNMTELFTPDALVTLLTLTSLEIVLGIDNIIFISILVGRLPAEQRQTARFVGLALAMLMRIALLLSLGWLMGLTQPFFSLHFPWDEAATGFSGRDLVLFFGGLFLLAKSTIEIHKTVEHEHDDHGSAKVSSFWGALVQIALLDIIFSLDSVITAVGMANQIPVMITAIIISIIVMMLAAKTISDFVDQNPTIKMLALSFLVLVGVVLVADGLHTHVPKGYIYFSMFFSLTVELLNMRMRKRKSNKTAA